MIGFAPVRAVLRGIVRELVDEYCGARYTELEKKLVVARAKIETLEKIISKPGSL